MSKWMKFTCRGTNEPVYLRTDLIATIKPSGNGSMLGLACEYDGFEVAERPEEVLTMLGEDL